MHPDMTGHLAGQARGRAYHALAPANARPDQHDAALSMLAAAGVAISLLFAWTIIVAL